MLPDHVSPEATARPDAGRTGCRGVSPFNLKKGKEGIGAWEIFARYNYRDIGKQIFTGGIASPNGNANRLSMIDVGCN
jgi:phosphate-selective porin OprO and OprP